MMKKNFLPSLILFLTIVPFLTLAAEKRTDGPPGSEYGDFSMWDGQFSLGARFGATSLSNGEKSSIAFGIDGDYRPTDIFGFRISFEQAVQKPRISLLHFAPVIHTDYSNFRPYAFFGPGFTLFSGSGDTKTKFSLASGIGGDFMLTEKLGFGLGWTYHWVFDSVDVHAVMARVSFWF